jgi:hypothetical protein
MQKRFVGLAAGLLAVTCPEMAAAQDFYSCDGYDDPQPKSDGMTTNSVLFGLARGSSDIREAPLLGIDAFGAAACDRALADARLLPVYKLRRAHLLQAKAMHQIGAGRAEQALATLTESDITGRALAGPYFQDSMGLGNRALRGFALISLGRRAEAMQEIEAIEAARPYAPSVTGMAMLLRLRLDNSVGAQLGLLRQRAVRDPAALMTYFVVALTSGKLAEAAAVGGGISFDLPSNHGGWTVQGDAIWQYEMIVELADLTGAWAYALASAGEPSGAAAAIAQARQDLADAVPSLPESGSGRSPSKTVMRFYAARTAQAERGQTTVDAWESAIALRQHAGGRSDEQITIALQALEKSNLPIMADLLRHVKMAESRADAARQDAIVKIDAATERARLEAIKLDVAALHDLLPRPETAGMQPQIRHSGDSYFFGDNSFSRRKLDAPDSWTVRFAHGVASKAAVEELALLSAATLAQREGFDGFIVLSRRTLARTTHYTGAFIAVREAPSGNEAQLNVLLVKGGALPERYRDAGWRLVNAQTVIDEMSGRYPGARPVRLR